MKIKDIFSKDPIDLTKVTFGSDNMYVLINFQNTGTNDEPHHELRGPTNEFGVSRFLNLPGDWWYCRMQDFIKFLLNASTGDLADVPPVETSGAIEYAKECKQALLNIKEIINNFV